MPRILIFGNSGFGRATLARPLPDELRGRGGGAGRIFQGRAGSLVRRGEALAQLEAFLASP